MEMELKNIVNCLNNLADGNDIDNSRIYIYNEAHAANARIAELEAALKPLAAMFPHYNQRRQYTDIIASVSSGNLPDAEITLKDAERAANLLDGDK